MICVDIVLELKMLGTGADIRGSGRRDDETSAGIRGVVWQQYEFIYCFRLFLVAPFSV